MDDMKQYEFYKVCRMSERCWFIDSSIYGRHFDTIITVSQGEVTCVYKLLQTNVLMLYVVFILETNYRELLG